MTNEFTEFDTAMMRRALELAECGVGQVSPSPLVGCVIVSQSGETVGEGCYTYDGLAHAETIALAEAGEKAAGGTAYVTLEPHHHHSRTPPCTEALLNAGIRRVVSPIEDPNPLVAGKGFEFLREQGVEVVTGILQKEAERQNEKYLHWHRTGRPFVHVKLAMSLDGRISLKESVSTRLSGKESGVRVQDLRHESDAILVGGNTAFVDNPSLTDRSGKPRRRKLVRVILDNRLQISLDSILVQTASETPTIVVTNSQNEEKIQLLSRLGVDLIRENARELSIVLLELKKRNLQSVLVEGGGEVAGAFADANLIDKLTLMIAPIIIGGHQAPFAFGGNGANNLATALQIRKYDINRHGDDYEFTGYPLKQIR